MHGFCHTKTISRKLYYIKITLFIIFVTTCLSLNYLQQTKTPRNTDWQEPQKTPKPAQAKAGAQAKVQAKAQEQAQAKAQAQAKEQSSSYCFPINLTDNLEASELRLPDILDDAEPPPQGKAIFFHETSCHVEADSVEMPKELLNYRQACAVESAAYNNPNTPVYLLFASPVTQNPSRPHPLLEILSSYPNLRTRNVNLWAYVANTTVQDWFQHGHLFHSLYPAVHMSDFLRLVTLWRYGGTHLDLDCLVQRSLENLPPNFVGAESSQEIATGVLRFAHNGSGHKLSTALLERFKSAYNGQHWSDAGPQLLTALLHKLCHTTRLDTVTEMISNAPRCSGIHVYPPDVFYPVHYSNWRLLFEGTRVNETMGLLENSYIVHFWNALSSSSKYKKGQSSVFETLAKLNCPKVYEKIQDEF